MLSNIEKQSIIKIVCKEAAILSEQWENVDLNSKRVAKAALFMALSEGREEEMRLKQDYQQQGLSVAAVNFGGEAASSVAKVLERAVVAARREGVIADVHNEEGAVAGAAHEALNQILTKAMGLNIGGKIGIARHHDHITVAMVMEIGLLHLNEVAVGMAHRAV
ncbi:MAG TPA: HutP family protein [Candidatus Avidehalobacter gallistercoris]|uniref:Hut operon positive regulatory protein n=1 Tax=Candidatus Avidehalobacter gallistercoris TaxID=2840694 RepID=A0A9D1KZH7_9FIRM|nr:HutP family protein [Candidatus Avidehalobacter gallistercoris]